MEKEAPCNQCLLFLIEMLFEVMTEFRAVVRGRLPRRIGIRFKERTFFAFFGTSCSLSCSGARAAAAAAAAAAVLLLLVEKANVLPACCGRLIRRIRRFGTSFFAFELRILSALVLKAGVCAIGT